MIPLSDRFSQLPALVLLILIEYVTVIVLFRWGSCCCHTVDTAIDTVDTADTTALGDIDTLGDISGATADLNDSTENSAEPSAEESKIQLKFENTYQSYNRYFQYLLLLTRVLSLGYILGISVIANELTMTDNKPWFYFTNWNTKLIAFYFFVTVISSISGVIDPYVPYQNQYLQNEQIGQNNPNSRSDNRSENRSENKLFCRIILHKKRILAKVIPILFEVSGGSAILVTVVAFGILDPTFGFWNVSTHFVTLITLLVEMMLNKMYVRYDHYPYNISWSLIYLVFVWVVVFSGLQRYWPYFFLQTKLKSCYFFYSGLFLADFLFYVVWYLLSEIKYSIVTNMKEMCLHRNRCVNTCQNNSIRNNYQSDRRTYVRVIKDEKLTEFTRDDVMF